MNYSNLPITPYNFGLELEKPSKYCQREIESESECDTQCDHCKEYYAPPENEALQTYQLQTGEKPEPRWVKFSEREPEGEFYVRTEYEMPQPTEYIHTQHGYLTYFGKYSYKGEEWADVAEHEKDLAIWYAGQKIYEGFWLMETEHPTMALRNEAGLEIWFWQDGTINLSWKKAYGPDIIEHFKFQTLCEWWGIENKIREV